MPPWFIDIESATEIEAKSKGTPPAARTPSHASRAKAPSSALHGVPRPSVEATPTNGFFRSSPFTPSEPRKARCGARSRPSTVIREGSFFFIFGDDLLDARASLAAAIRHGALRHCVHDLLQMLVRREADFPLRAVLDRVPHLLRADADAGKKESPGHRRRALECLHHAAQ